MAKKNQSNKLILALKRQFILVCSWFCEIILNFRASYFIMVLNSTTNGELVMLVSYDKLWKLLIDKKMNRTELKDAAGISFNVLAKLGRNEFVSMESLQKICQTLSCNIGEIMDFIEEEPVEHRGN